MQNTDMCAPPRRRQDAFSGILQILVVVSGLLGGGITIGYFLGVQSVRSDSLAEIERLQLAHQGALDAIAGRQSRVVGQLGEVAGMAANAAETAQAAATTAGKAAKAAGVPAATIERDRKAINTTIQRANERIAGEGAR